MTNDSNNHAEEIKEIHNRLNAHDKKIEELKKQLDAEDPYKPTAKGKKAKNKLDEVGEAIKKIKAQLDKARATLEKTANPVSKDEKKKRSMVAIAPERIEVDFNSMKFYIDFTVVASERDGQSNIKGSIIYGTSRTLCFIFPNNENNCKECQRTVRCDGLEDKPLISFEVSQHGMIQSSGKLEGEWWIKDIPDLVELHYRALDLIWKEALDWANEIILP
jgi:hypothetical protein